MSLRRSNCIEGRNSLRVFLSNVFPKPLTMINLQKNLYITGVPGGLQLFTSMNPFVQYGPEIKYFFVVSTETWALMRQESPGIYVR